MSLVLLQTSVAEASPRVLGMGNGLFGFIFIGIICVFIVIIGRCAKEQSKRLILSVVVPLVIFGLPLLIVLSSPRADPYATSKADIEYDQTYIPRIVVGIFQALFVVVAVVSVMVTHACKPVQASRIEDDIEMYDPASHVFK